MIRADELTLRLADQEITEAEDNELRHLLAAEPGTRDRHVRLLRLQAALHGDCRRPGLAGPVMEQIYRARQQRVVDGVLQQLPGRPAPVARPRRSMRALLPAAVAVAVAMTAVFAFVSIRRDVREATEVPRPFNGRFATVVAIDGQAHAQREPLALPLVPGLRLRPGERLETGAGGAAIINYRDHTTLTLGQHTQLTLEDPQRSRDRVASVEAQVVHLGLGMLRAQVGLQPQDRALLFLTPHARITVVGTALALHVTAQATRLEVTDGKVLFERLDTNRIEEIRAGQQALAGDETEATLPVPAAPAAPEPAATVVFSYDFEDGESPKAIKQGALVTGPCRPGSRFCAIGTLDPYDWTGLVVAAVGSPNVAYFSPGMVLSFDYWAGADVKELRVQSWNSDQYQNHNLEVPNATPEAWSHAEVRLGDAAGDKKLPWQPGDRIQNIRVHGGRTGGKPFYVDNIRLVDRPQTSGGTP